MITKGLPEKVICDQKLEDVCPRQGQRRLPIKDYGKTDTGGHLKTASERHKAVLWAGSMQGFLWHRKKSAFVIDNILISYDYLMTVFNSKNHPNG